MIDRRLAEALSGDVSEWIAVLPSYQQSVLNDMLARDETANVAVAWLSTTGPADTAPFGGVRAGASLFYEKLLEQIRILLCSDQGYEEERANLLRDARAGRAAVVTAIATAIAPLIGAAPVVIAPAVALTLALLSRAGVDAVCDTLNSMIAERAHEGATPPAEGPPAEAG